MNILLILPHFPDSKKHTFSHNEIFEIGLGLAFDIFLVSMLKNYTALLKFQENIHAHNFSHGTVNTKMANKIPKEFYKCLSCLKFRYL